MLSSKSVRRFSFLATTTACLIGAMPAFAQETKAATDDAAPDDQTIIVRGQRQQYLGDAPVHSLSQNVQTLDSRTLKDAGITKLAAALDFVAGVARQNNFGGFFDSYAIRGFAGDESSASNYLINGFPASRGYGGARDASNIEQIQVIKGPTSALFGRGDPGGAVNIITKKPNFTTGGSFTASGGSFNTFRGEGDINLALTDRVAVRVTGAYEDGDSFRDYIHSRKYTFTPSVLFQISEDTSLSYELEYVHAAAPFDRGIVAVNGNLNTVPRSRFLGEPGDGPVTTEALGHQAQLQHDFSSDWSLLIGAGYRTSSFKGYATEAESTASRQALYVDGKTLTRQRRLRDYKTTDLTFRTELSGKFTTFGLQHHLQVGADWDEFTLDQVQQRFRAPAVAAQTTAVRGNQINIFNPVYGNLATVGAFINSVEDDVSWGAYLQDQIDLTSRLKLRGGVRYDNFDQAIRNRLNNVRSGQQKTALSPTVGLAYAVSEPIEVYASYGRGFRPNVSFDVNNQPFAPERTKSYEVGAKLSAFGNRLNGAVAFYTMTKSAVLTADPINSGFSLAIGEARSRGVEVNVSGKLPYGFRVDLSYAYTDAIVAKDAVDPNFGYALRRGDPLINIPKNSASALVFKDFSVFDRKANVGVGVNYVGKRLGETGYRFADGSFFMLPSYTLTRVMASFSPTDRIKVSGEVTNLFDVQYFPSSYSRLWVMPGAPRQFMAHLSYSF